MVRLITAAALQLPKETAILRNKRYNYSMIKQSSGVQISYPISDKDKEQGKKAIKAFKSCMDLLKAANDHLDIMFSPFKDNPNISPEYIIKYRASIRAFRDKAIENFNQFKIGAFQCYTVMNIFSSDTQTLKLMKSFISSIEEIESKVNDFSSLFADLQSKTFVTDIVDNMEKIHKASDDLKEIVETRIIKHIEKNIVGQNWIDGVSNELAVKIEKNNPIMMDLLNNVKNKAPNS